MEYPKVIDENPLHIDAKALHEAVNRYYDDPIADRVALAIASYANSNGVAFPGFPLLAELTGYTYEQISRATHRLQALGILTISRRRRKGAEHAHDVYKFCKRLVRKVIDICSAHFIANVKKWRAEGRDVAQAIKKKARQSLDTLTAKAEKMAQLFQQRPELMDNPERAAELARVADNTAAPSVFDAAPVQTEPVQWENGATWADAATEPMPKPKMDHTATLAALFSISAPVDVKPVKPEPSTLDDSPLPLYMQNTAPAEHSWRRHVPGYQKTAATV